MNAVTPADAVCSAEPVRDVPYSGSTAGHAWWNAHFHQASDELIDFFAGDGISLTGKSVADIGCGDGIIDLALALKVDPQRLVGFDLVHTDGGHLVNMARTNGLDLGALPDCLSFVRSGEATIPAETDSFDIVITWSAFEHIIDVDGIAGEIRRILKPGGRLFLQLWPFYPSAHGTHLVDWFPDGFAQYENTDEQILSALRSADEHDQADHMFEAYHTLNRITLDDLGSALRRNGLRVVKLALQGDAVHIPASAAHLPLSHVGVGGVMLLAVPYDDRSGERFRPPFTPSGRRPSLVRRALTPGAAGLQPARRIADRLRPAARALGLGRLRRRLRRR